LLQTPSGESHWASWDSRHWARCILINIKELEFPEFEIPQNGKRVNVSGLQFDKSKERITTLLKNKIIKSSMISFEQKFKGSLLHGAVGFHRVPAGNERWIVAT
jgi:hypothetical protein